MDKVDNIDAGIKWQFGSDVTQVFDDMLARSIPQYEVMRQAVTNIGLKYAQPDTWIIDLGCSRGGAIAPFVDRLDDNRFLGIEVSEPMVMASCYRFASDERVVIRQTDLRSEYPHEMASVTLSILTLQFIPIEYRQTIIQDVYDHLEDGGVFIFVEKILGSNAPINQLMVDIYYSLKDQNGYTPEQIERKRLSLEGVLVPVTAKWNEELLHMAGFKQVDCFWRWMNFAGWIAVKGER